VCIEWGCFVREAPDRQDSAMLPAIGYAIRVQNRPLPADPAVNAAEITCDGADAPLQIGKYLRDHQFDVVSVRTRKLNVASPAPPRREDLDALRVVAQENNAQSVSDQLGCTRDGADGVEPSCCCPPPCTQPALDVVCRNIDAVQKFFGRTRFYIENIARLVQYAGAMTEAEFLCQVLQNTGCGWRLNVTNVYANGRNFGFDAYDFIAEVMPVASHVQLLLTGGYFDRRAKLYLDNPAQPVPDEIWSLYRHALVLGGHKTSAVFLAREHDVPQVDGRRQEVRHARFLAERVAARQRMLRSRPAAVQRA
jgi:hypothetical protein